MDNKQLNADLIKKAIEVLKPYKTHKITHHLPSKSRNSTLTLDEAKAISNAMAAAAAHGALDNTQVHLNGAVLRGLQNRSVDNERNSGFTRFMNSFSDPFEGQADKSQSMPDAFLPYHDAVWLPSGNPGVLMHELGHAADMNEFPNTPFRRFTSGVYTRFAPTLWHEHAAWRKGKNRFIDGSAKTKIDPKLFVRTLEDAARTKPMGLGSYWGAGLGTALGGGLGVLGGAALSNGRDPNLALRLGALGLALGGGLGGLTGLTLGKWYGNRDSLGSDKAKERYLNLYAKAYAKEHDMSLEEALSALKNYGKAKSTARRELAGSSNLKAAAFGARMGKLAAAAPAQTGTAPAAAAGSFMGNMANRAIQSPTGQRVLGGVAAGYNRFMPQAGKNFISNRMPTYATESEMSLLKGVNNVQPAPYQSLGTQHGSMINAHSMVENDKLVKDQIDSHTPVRVTGSPLQQIGFGLSTGQMPAQTFQQGRLAGLNQRVENDKLTQNNLSPLNEQMFPELKSGVGAVNPAAATSAPAARPVIESKTPKKLF